MQNKKRNRLQVYKVDKLVFIRKNMRVLEKGSLRWNPLSEEELLELKDDIVVSFSVGANFSCNFLIGLHQAPFQLGRNLLL